MNELRPADAAIADARSDGILAERHDSGTGLDGLGSRCTPPVALTITGTTEQRLVRAGDGEQRAFAEVYDATSPRVFGLVLHIVRDRAEAKEVTQEVYLEAWRRASRFDPERGTAITWLLQIAHSRAVDRVRVSRMQRARSIRIGIRDAPMPISVVAERTETSTDAARPCQALAQLSVVQREAIELAYFHGLTRTDIAERVGVPLGTVKTRLQDGMTRLRYILA